MSNRAYMHNKTVHIITGAFDYHIVKLLKILSQNGETDHWGTLEGPEWSLN